ncbi:MAG: isochorismate synthase [Flavobacteriales bacterium]|jgi:isochorismate synthase|nr:isochorismate synthase [Flavobacteriales bacterium]
MPEINRNIHSKSFALWRMPNESKVFKICQESSGNYRFVMAPFEKKEQKRLVISANIIEEVSDNEINSWLNAERRFHKKEEQKEVYSQDFEKFLTELQSSSPVQKLVLARSIQIKTTAKAEHIFAKLQQKFPDAFVYLFFDGTEYWLAATPEILLSKKDSKLKTMALAGTSFEEKKEQIHWTSKEFREHQLVVDYITQKLQEVKLKPSFQKEPQTVKAGFVWHLKTPIECDIPDAFDLNKLTQKLHPTPAVCGTPMKEAYDFILEKEQLNRRFYTGYVGIEQENEAHYFVNLRCMMLKNETAEVFVGGGLLSDSDFEKEWEETISKSKTIISCL